jgi:hypothetical protein
MMNMSKLVINNEDSFAKIVNTSNFSEKNFKQTQLLLLQLRELQATIRKQTKEVYRQSSQLGFSAATLSTSLDKQHRLVKILCTLTK